MRGILFNKRNLLSTKVTISEVIKGTPSHVHRARSEVGSPGARSPPSVPSWARGGLRASSVRGCSVAGLRHAAGTSAGLHTGARRRAEGKSLKLSQSLLGIAQENHSSFAAAEDNGTDASLCLGKTSP